MAAKMAARPYYYLQEMSELENRHPDVYLKFVNGRHVVRRSNKYWAGQSSEFVIEQTLMRSHKTSGGLTHGGGMNKEQRSLWTVSMPVTAMYNIAMQDFNNLTYTTSDQHKETTDARLNRDVHDLAKINSRLIPFTPFSEDRSLRNIVTGIEAPSDTNVHEDKAVGMNIINTMVSQAAFQYYFKRKDRAKTLGLPGDADIDIVKTVVDSSHPHSTTLIREDTDLLILLLHYADTDPDIKDLYFRSEKTCATNVQDINRLKAIRHQTYIHSFSSFMHSLVVIQRQGYLVSERRRLSRN